MHPNLEKILKSKLYECKRCAEILLRIPPDFADDVYRVDDNTVWLSMEGYQYLLDFMREARGGFAFSHYGIFGRTSPYAEFRKDDVDYVFNFHTDSDAETRELLSKFGMKDTCRFEEQTYHSTVISCGV